MNHLSLAAERALPGIKDLFPEHFGGQRLADTSLTPAKRSSDAAQIGQPSRRAFVFANEVDDELVVDDNGAEDDPDIMEKRRHPCPRCGKRFNRPSSLKIHLNTHTGIKPFECPFPGCGRSFNVSSNMRRHFRNHSRRPPPPPIPTNAYPIIGATNAGNPSWSVRERYRYPHPRPPSPPTPPYTNEPASPPPNPIEPEQVSWEENRTSEDDFDEEGLDSVTVAQEDEDYGSDDEEYGSGPMQVQELGSGGRGPKGLKWKRDSNWLQFRSILVPVSEKQKTPPDTPSMRTLYPGPNGLTARTPTLYPAPTIPERLHEHPQHPQSHERRHSLASNASYSSESASGSGSNSSNNGMRTASFPRPQLQFAAYTPIVSYPCYTYPPPAIPMSAATFQPPPNGISTPSMSESESPRYRYSTSRFGSGSRSRSRSSSRNSFARPVATTHSRSTSPQTQESVPPNPAVAFSWKPTPDGSGAMNFARSRPVHSHGSRLSGSPVQS